MSSSVPVKVRFAPSPTGYLHIGSARTALFNWLYARHCGGKFYLRIEDTDKERSKQEFLDEIVSSLKWLGLDWDGELVFQSKRTEFYREVAQKLLDKDMAYMDGQAIRFRSPKEGKIVVDDLLHGKVEFDATQFEDLVIFKSDGGPTYNFAVVCDDADMGITHVIRGDDHIMNTPKQLPLYEALGYKKPMFCHIPLILGPDRSRMSKRHGATSIREYQEAGYLPEALVNFLSLLGWSPGNNQEIISREELIKKFDLERVLTTGAVFNHDKLEWLNGQYVRSIPIPDLCQMLIPILEQANFAPLWEDHTWYERLVTLFQERIFRLKQFPELCDFIFKDEIEYSQEIVDHLLKDVRLEKAFTEYARALSQLSDFSTAAVEPVSRQLMKDLGMTGKEFIHPCRMALTGRSVSPGFFDVVSLLGAEKCAKRLHRAASLFQK